jgi:hypothetical protein
LENNLDYYLMLTVSRILEFIQEMDYSKRFFYQKTGISNGYLDKVKSVSSGKMERILSAFPDLNFEWMATGKGPMLKNSAYRPEIGEVSPNIREERADYSDLKMVLSEQEKLLIAKDQTIAAQLATISSLKQTIELLQSIHASSGVSAAG